MDSNKEIERLMNEWDLSEKQAHLLNNAFENDNLDAMKFYNIMKDDDYENISFEVAEDVVRNYGINDNLHLSGFEEYMNDCLSEKSELKRTFTEHPYLNDETNKIELPKSEVSPDEIFVDILKDCEKRGDEANSELAKKTLKKIPDIGFKKALDQMALDCFKDPKTGRTLSYSEMRSIYG